MIPEILLGGMLLLVVGGLADSIWRLWQGRPRPFHAWPDCGLYFVMVFATLQLPAWQTRDLIAKIAMVVAVHSPSSVSSAASAAEDEDAVEQQRRQGADLPQPLIESLSHHAFGRR